MKDAEKNLVNTLTLLTIVVSLSSVGSMLVYYAGTFELLVSKTVYQAIVFVLAIASFIYMGYAMYLYHHQKH